MSFDDVDDEQPRRGSGRPRKSPFNMQPIIGRRESLRAAARANDHTFSLNGAARTAPARQPLGEHELQLRRAVLAAGKPGVIESISRSLATGKVLVTVEHTARIRITYNADDIFSPANP